MPRKETRAREKAQIITSTHQLNCILGRWRNLILTQSDTWEMTVRHMLTSKHLCNYWCWSLRAQLGNLLCEVISSTWKRRKKKPPLAHLPICVSTVCQGKDNRRIERREGGGFPSLRHTFILFYCHNLNARVTATSRNKMVKTIITFTHISVRNLCLSFTKTMQIKTHFNMFPCMDID